MKCPNCKASGKMSVCRSGVAGSSPVFVECACGWSQAPLDALVIDAAVYTWHRANPTPAPDPATFVNYSVGLDTAYGREKTWVIWKTTFSGRSVAKTLGEMSRDSAQAELDAFLAEKAAA